MNKRERLIIWTLSTLLAFEIVALLLVAYLARLEEFFMLFISALKLISPVLFTVNAAFLISNVFIKGKELTIKTWKEHLWELFKFFILSFIITLIFITISAFVGTLIGVSLRKVYSFPTIREVVSYLQKWVSENFY